MSGLKIVIEVKPSEATALLDLMNNMWEYIEQAEKKGTKDSGFVSSQRANLVVVHKLLCQLSVLKTGKYSCHITDED